jgi:putative holliday junction resolvase
MRVLALDLGTKRIGVAVSDLSGTIATPRTVLARSGSVKRDHLVIQKLVAEEEAELVIVGLPLNMNGTYGPAAKGAVAEAAELASVVGVPVETFDERMTTVSADRVLKEANVTARNRRKVVDKIAAAVILQAWLDQQAFRR